MKVAYGISFHLISVCYDLHFTRNPPSSLQETSYVQYNSYVRSNTDPIELHQFNLKHFFDIVHVKRKYWDEQSELLRCLISYTDNLRQEIYDSRESREMLLISSVKNT
jgi:hypothetical protein